MLQKLFSFDRIIRITSIIFSFFLISFVLFFVNHNDNKLTLLPAESLQKAAAFGSIGFMVVVIFVLLFSSKNND